MTTPHAAAVLLVERVLGSALADAVTVRIDGDENDRWFQVRAEAGRVELHAGSPVGIAVALRHYLTRACRIDTSWDRATPVGHIAEFPDWESGRVETPFELRYDLNYCTFGYTTAYWTWEDWEREIDWMAMHGINLPLAIVGYEAIWMRVLVRRGMTPEAARSYLGSPAYLPWLWMGCVHDLGAALTQDWLDAHLELGRRIVARQRELGMKVVLPAFAGYVPEQLAQPGTPEVEWFGFTNRQLAPEDPLFTAIGRELLEEVAKEFGSDGYYALDPFIEGRPPYEVPDGVGAVASAIHGFLNAHDPDSVWVLQAWPFGYARDYWSDDHVAAFLTAVPRGRLLVLDLWAEHLGHAERTTSFHGHDWAWCMLNNFGGRSGSHGAWASVADVRRAGAVGTGFTMEALDRNAVMFELMADAQWSAEQIRPADVAAARYQSTDPRLAEAFGEWMRLCFQRDTVRHAFRSVVLARPSFTGDRWPTSGTMQGPYPDASVVTALESVLRSYVSVLAESGEDAAPGLVRDVTDLGLEVLSGHAYLAFDDAIAGHDAGDPSAFSEGAHRLARVIATMDRLAATHPRFLLGAWLESAGRWGADPEDVRNLRRDARRLITTWVDPGHPLNDYAGRHWSGLLEDYYGARWTLWIEGMQNVLDGTQLTEAEFESRLRAFEHSWLEADPACATTAAGSAVTVLQEFWAAPSLSRTTVRKAGDRA
jgi:alpha-N-acetylglucosaminidase